MELIERYVSAVGRRLPHKVREDIRAELKSLILDALEGRFPDKTEYSEEDITAVLRDFGPPAEAAARYAPSARYLIGPQLFEIYLLVAGIVLAVSVFGTVMALIIELSVNNVPLAGLIPRLLPGILPGAVTSLGFVTLIFAVLERVLPDKEKESLLDAAGKWDPRKLPPAVPQQRVKIGESAVSVFFSLLLLIMLNFFAHRLGVYFKDGTQWQFIETVNRDVVAGFLPYWNALLLASLFHHVVLLVKRHWSVGSRLLGISLSIAALTVLSLMLRKPLILPEGFLALGGTAAGEDLLRLGRLLAAAVRIGLILAIAGNTVDLAKQLSALFKTKAQTF